MLVNNNLIVCNCISLNVYLLLQQSIPATTTDSSAGQLDPAAASLAGVIGGAAEGESAEAKAAAAEKKRQARKPLKAVVERPKRALFCLDLKNPFRMWCIRLVEWK